MGPEQHQQHLFAHHLTMDSHNHNADQFGMVYQPMNVNIEQKILCCSCGTPIPPNASNMCINCIRNEVDITEGIPKQSTIHFCKACERYLQPPNYWVEAQLESKELLALCLKKLKGLGKVRLVDASFIWTEPHSRRVKVKLVIQKEVFASTVLQQAFVVEYIVAYQQCDDCTRVAAQNTWKAVVQVRQKVPHKRTFFFLEQVILKHNAHANTVNIKETRDGLDFFYANKQHAHRMIEFLASLVPVRIKSSEKVISEDIKNNTVNSKQNFSVEIIPICRDDLLCLPTRLARGASNISPLCLCYKVGSSLYIIDPNTCQTSEIRATTYWEHPFHSLAGTKELVEFYVIDVQYENVMNGKYQLATVELSKNDDFENTFITRTHLGRVLKPGDTVLGYDLTNVNFNNDEWDHLSSLHGTNLPDVILVRKSFSHARKKSKNRKWRLKQLNKVEDEEVRDKNKTQNEIDYEMFLRDLEEDEELRGMVNLYKAPVQPSAMETESEMGGDEDLPEIKLEELLEDLTLEDTPME